MTPVAILDYVTQGLALFTSQFSAALAPQLRAWTASYLAEAQKLEAAIWDVINLRQLANAVIYSPPPGTFDVTNGSTLVTCSAEQFGVIFPGNEITFASQPLASYVVEGVFIGALPFDPPFLTLVTPYTGTSTPNTSAETSQTNPVLDINGALVGQPRLGQDDLSYLSTIYLRVAVNNSNATVASWSGFAEILLRTSGGPVFYFESGTGGTGVGSSFFFGVWDMTLNPSVVAAILNDAVPDGEGPNCFAWSTWPDGDDFACGSIYEPATEDRFTSVLGTPLSMGGNLVPGLFGGGYGTEEGGFGSVYDSTVGGLMVAATALN